MFKKYFTKTVKTTKTFDEIVSIVQNELNIVGHANVSSKGRIFISEFIQKNSSYNAATPEVEGSIKQNGENVTIELNINTRSIRWALITLALTVFIFIGFFLLPTYILMIYLTHLSAIKTISKALKNIAYDLE